jgi:DNA-directed RNA polymerase specialized sigma24 family protein
MDIDRLMDTLPEKQARAIRQTRLNGHSMAEAARNAGIGESDVKVSVHRGLKSLAARFRGDRP